MEKNNLLKISEDTKNVILEVSALSGISQNVVKEVFEYMLVNWAIKVADNQDEFANLDIPYLGSISVKYAGDKILTSGDLYTEIESFSDISNGFRSLIGTIHDEGRSALEPMLEKKINQAIMVAGNTSK